MTKLVVLRGRAFDYEPWGIYKDRAQLIEKLREFWGFDETWGTEEDFDLEWEMEEGEMKMYEMEDFSN